jgi:fibronectin type III domain protein
MARKQRLVRALDIVPANQTLALAPDDSADDLAPPLPNTALEPPTNLVLTPALARSASTPTALINATWDAPAGVTVDKYTVQWSVVSTFPAGQTMGADTIYEGAVIDGLQTNKLYYVRVSAWEHGIQSQWSVAVSTTTPQDTVAPAVPTGASGTFVNAGDLLIAWTEPSLSGSPNLRDIEVRIWESSAKTTNYLTDYSATGQYIFTVAMNGKATSYAYDPSLYVELRSRSWGNQFSTAVVVGTLTKAVPSNPTGLSVVWDAAAGSLIFDFNDVVGANQYEFILDSKTYLVPTSKFVYDVARNRNDHGGTPGAAIAYSIKAMDALLQKSTGLTGTATLARPATPTGLATSWAGDTGSAGPDCNITWDNQTGVALYRVMVDTIVHDLLATRLNYNFDKNRAEHAGTPDPALAISLVAVDGLGQTSTTPASTTATNVAPPTPTAALAGGAVSLLVATAGGTLAADFDRYEFVFKRDSTAVATREQAEAVAHYELSGANDGGLHDWTVTVRQKDRFGQFSTSVTSSTLTFDGLTIASIRADCTYTDSDGNTATTLNALKDNITTSGGVTYNP